MTPRRGFTIPTAGWIAAILLLGTIAYWPSLHGVFLFDDLTSIQSQTWLDDWSSAGTIWRSSQRWVADLSFLATVQWFGREPFGFHVGNLVIHLATALALFGWVRVLLESEVSNDGERSGRATQLAGTIASLWVVHPLTTQAVTYIVQRYESLAACWMLLALWGYALAIRQPQRAVVWSLVAALCAWLALQTKQTGIVTPVLAAMYERVYGTETLPIRLRRRGAFYLVLGPVILYPLLSIVTSLGSAPPPANGDVTAVESATPAEEPPKGSTNTLTSVPLVENDDFAGFDYFAVSPWEYLRSQGGVLCHYVWLAVWPYPLCFDYGWPVAETVATWLPGGLAVLAVLLAAVVLWWRGSRWGFLLLAPFICLAPTSTIIPLRDLAAEHRVYLPLAFWITTACLALDQFVRPPRARRLLPVAAIGVGLCWGVLTFARNCDYQDAVRLWQHTAEVAPQNPRAWYNWGHALLDAGRPDEAIPVIERALELEELPQNRRFLTANELAVQHNRLGTAWHATGQFDQALREYDIALEADPGNGLAHHNRANTLAIAGDVAAAHAAYERAAKLLPRDAKVHLDWGNLLAQHGRFDEAIPHFTTALERQPQLVDALMNRGTAYLEQGRLDASQRDLEATARLLADDDPRSPAIAQWLQLIRQARSAPEPR